MSMYGSKTGRSKEPGNTGVQLESEGTSGTGGNGEKAGNRWKQEEKGKEQKKQEERHPEKKNNNNKTGGMGGIE